VRGLAIEEGIRRLGGNPELYRSLTQQFERQLDSDLPRLRELLGDRRWDEAKRVLHALKGAAATVAANRTAAAAAALEALLGEERDPAGGLAELETAATEVVREIRRLEGGGGTPSAPHLESPTARGGNARETH